MADEFDDPILPGTQDTEDTPIQGEPEVQPPVVPQSTIDPMQMRILEAQESSKRVLEQIAQRQAMMPQQREPEPQYDPQVIAAASPLIKHVLKSELGEVGALKNELQMLRQSQQDMAEERLVRSLVPDFDQQRDAIAGVIHEMLDAQGVPRDVNVRRQFFNPSMIAMARKTLGAPTAQPPAKPAAVRPFVEGRGETPSPTQAPGPVDYLNMSDAEFAKMEAKINAQRNSRNRG